MKNIFSKIISNNKKGVIMQKIQPLKDKILIRPKKEEKTTASGIVIPETVEGEKPQEGEVIAVGTGRTINDGKIIPLEVKVGDKVLFSKYALQEIKIDGEELNILSESDVLAIIK